MPLSFPLIVMPSCMGDTCGFALVAIDFLYKSAIVVFFYVLASSTASCCVETFATFDDLDNVLSGYDSGCDVPSVGTPLASCSSRITGLYLDVFRKCSEFYGVKLQRECSTTFRGRLVIFGRVSEVFSGFWEGFVCAAGHGSLASRDDGNTRENCQLSSTIGVSNNGSSASRQGRNVKVRPRPISAAGVPTTSRRTSHRVLTSANAVDPASVASSGTSYTYSDFGDCDRYCRYCGASFWYTERLKGHSHNQSPEYHLCCGGGRIHMQPPREPPEYIKSLFGNKHFMENIHAYNQMFAMASFGAKIYKFINVRRGSYVFKVSSQIYHWIGSLCLPTGEAPRFLQLYIYDTDNEVQNRMHHFGGIDNSQLV
ncbi:hypothetical protein Tco_0486422 [Tanacetum coccineum]